MTHSRPLPRAPRPWPALGQPSWVTFVGNLPRKGRGPRCFARACALEESRRDWLCRDLAKAVLNTAAPATMLPRGAAAPTTAPSTQAGSRRPELAAVNDPFLALDARNESFTAPKATSARPATDFAGALPGEGGGCPR